jgi:electron transfer flavoprotein beta subunit
MNIIVCVKRVPDTSEAEVVITKDGRRIEESDLVFDINEWDKYAVEEAALLKEKLGGSITVLAVGPEEVEDTLRRCFATGADNAIRLTDRAFDGSDAATTARILYETIKNMEFDLILTGVQASDDGYGQVGPTLAHLLGVPHATMVTGIEIIDGGVRVHQELEGGLEEVVEVCLPALLTIQTGINEPRYVSIMGVRKAAKQEIKVIDLKGLGLREDEVGEAGSKTKEERLFLPPVTKETETLQGSPDEVATRLAQILKDKGGLA